MAREIMSASLGQEIASGLSQLMQGKLRASFSYRDLSHVGAPSFGPYGVGEEVTAYSSWGKMYVVKALDEGLGFKVTTGNGRKTKQYAAGQKLRIGKKVFIAQ